LEREHPNLKETMLSAMGNVDTGRLLNTRFQNLDGPLPLRLLRNPSICGRIREGKRPSSA
jgi:hypothetical protein